MIRFNCPHCARAYLLPDALARLPLMCKGCGHRLDVPDPGPDNDPLPEPPADHPPEHVPPPDEPLFSTDTSSKIDFDIVPPAKPPLLKPALPPPSPSPPANRLAVGLVVDVLIGLLLAIGGAFVGEVVTQKSTGAVFAAAAKEMPPVDLMVWIGCVAFPVLVYVLIANRGKSVGGWLKRRA